MLAFIKHHTFYCLLFFTLFAAFLHFYNLNWGAPFYFHPDERNIASAVSQLAFPNQFNPHFFAYGSLPIYTIFFTGLLFNSLTSCHGLLHSCSVSFEQAILISRAYSALFATLLIPLMYLLGKQVQGRGAGLFAAGLTVFSSGVIQFSHFGTFEMWLTFFTTLFSYTLFQFITTQKERFLWLSSLCIGVLFAVKVTSLALAPLGLLGICFPFFRHKLSFSHIFRLIRFLSIFLFFGTLIYVVTNPYVFLDPTEFFNSMHYESSVALGSLPVFYTGEFFNTIPAVFQFLHVYPFLLNPVLTLLIIPALLIVSVAAIKYRQPLLILLILFWLVTFFSQATLFVKWTRYLMPTLPFVYLILTLAMFQWQKLLQFPTRRLGLSVGIIIFSTAVIFSLAYFITAYIRLDTREQAVAFAKKQIPENATILSEVYDLGIVPFNSSYPNIQLFNFYDLDNNSSESSPEALQQALDHATYIILPSQRILKTRILQQRQFSRGYRFYTYLTTGNLGFTKIYQTPCDMLCRIAYFGDPVWNLEETATVFDRPTVYIFKKTP